MSSSSDMAEIAKLVQVMQEKQHPYVAQLGDLMRAVGDVGSLVDEIGARWTQDFLVTAKAPDKANPAGQDYDSYASPLIVVAEMLRKQTGFKGLAHRIYAVAARLADKHCTDTGTDLHRGALYADLAIAYFEQSEFELGLSWLLASANEDVRFNRVPTVYDSYALSDDGIFGQWVKQQLLPSIPSAVLDFVNAQLGTAYGFPDVMRFLRALAGQGDLNLLAGVVNFTRFEGRSDYVAQSVRFTCLRDLATLTEVLLKRIGLGHPDVAVRNKFADSPMLGGVVHHMHYHHGARHADLAKRLVRTEGLFWNSVRKENDLIAGIDAGFDSVKDFNSVPIAAVHTYLDTTTLVAAVPNADALAKRFLLAYRLRNETSHSFRPSDAGMIAHAAEFRTWLLQTLFYSFFFFRDSGQAAF
ncbi:MAG: hypothetical protein U0804_01320 [Gemmataceae bacterium]